MSTNKIITIITLMLVVGLGAYFIISINSQTTAPNSPAIQQTSTTTQEDTTAEGNETAYFSFTLADVAKHSDAKSCWVAINNKVYDLTSWINQHPGGPDKILSICGKDGSAAFNGQHGGKQKQANILAGFFIGDLK